MTSVNSGRIVVLGGTGYLGSRLIPLLAGRGHRVVAIVRSGSSKSPSGASVVEVADPLDPHSLQPHVRRGDTVVQLIGVPKPAPWKGPQFRAVDLVAGLAAIKAATQAGVSHFVYVSVAHPAPIMKEYIAVRNECEAVLQTSGLSATILRPWYILGPGHWWPLLLKPAYWFCERWSQTSASATRLGLVTIHEMLQALVWAVEHPANPMRVLEVPDIKAIGAG